MLRFLLARPSVPMLTVPAVIVAAAAIVFARPIESRSTTDHVEDMTALSQGLETRVQMHADRLEYKRDLIRRLADQEVTLADVTAEFLAMNQDVPAIMTAIRFHFDGASDVEKTAANVIEYLRGAHLPAERDREVRARLVHEYEAMFGHSPAPSR